MFHTLSSLLFGTSSAAAVASSRDPTPVRTLEEEVDGWVVLELVRGVESTELVACDPQTTRQEERPLERLGTSWCSDAGLRLVTPDCELLISRSRAHPTPTIVPIFPTASSDNNNNDDEEAGQHLRRRWQQQQQRGHVLTLGPPPQLLPRRYQQHHQQHHHHQHHQQHHHQHHQQQQRRRGSRARQRVALSALHQPCGRAFNF
ncbi:uncharacterized protein LOC116954257 [Petromyzon marinus]|uniref:uncharacterized protein LOC116954257 n=1 Tax=Petromyzon marinus TaxID=7757 RepID=UPI003F72F3A2